MNNELLISRQPGGTHVITESEYSKSNTFFKIEKDGHSLWVTLEALRLFEDGTFEEIVNSAA